MDSILTKAHDAYLLGQLTTEQLQSQMTDVFNLKFKVMGELPPWGQALGIGGGTDLAPGHGGFALFYLSAEPLDASLHSIIEQHDFLRLGDYLGAYDRAGIFLRGFKHLFDGSGTADLTEIVHLTDQMETIFLHLFDTDLDAAVDQIVNLKYKVMGKLPDPVPGVSFIALYSGFRDLDHQLDKVVETAAAADATFSLTDKFDVAAEISEATKDKKSLEKSFPPTK